jgi:hypothetical protein
MEACEDGIRYSTVELVALGASRTTQNRRKIWTTKLARGEEKES